MASPLLPAGTNRASPLSSTDKGMLVELVREHLEVINDKNTKYYAINKKAQAWQEIASKFNDLTGNNRTAVQVRKIYENMRNR